MTSFCRSPRSLVTISRSSSRIVRVRPEKSEVSRLQAESSKALQLAGWRAEVSLDEGLRRTADWIEAHLDEYRTQEYAV